MNQGLFITFDLPSIWQSVKKNLIKITVIAITAIMITYVLFESFIPVRYSTKVMLSIVTDNKGLISNSNRIYVAGKRIQTYLTGDTVKTVLCEQMGVKESEFTGKLAVEVLSSNNLILITCTDVSKEATFKLAEAVRDKLPAILERFMKVYNLEVMGQNDVSKISKQSRSSVVLAVLVGMLVFCMELFLVILFQIFSKKVQNRSQIEEELDQTLVGVVPHDKHRKKTESMLVDSGLRSLDYIESFQRIASSIMHLSKKEDARVLMVTSCLENEGKSTIASNLALTISKTGKKVLLIDLDLRKPALHRIMEVKEYGDFGQYLKNGQSVANVISKRGKNLYCCFTKPLEGQADEILEKNGIEHFLENAKEKVDYVILDSSPMANTRDAEVLMNLADATVLVTRMNAAPIPLINDKIEILEEGKATFLGLILNDEYNDAVHSKSTYYNYQYRYQKK